MDAGVSRATGLSPEMRGHLAMLCFSAVVAGSFSLGSLVANEIAPAALNTVRFFISALVVGIVALLTGSLDRSFTRAPWRYLMLGGLYAAYFVLMFEGLKTAAPVSIAAVFTLTPPIAAAFGWMLLRQITTPRMASALLIGGIGAVWVVFRADINALMAFRLGTGEMIYFFGVICHAIYAPMARLLTRGQNPLALIFGVLLAGFLVLLVFGWRDIQATDWVHLPAIVWITITYTALFATALSIGLVQYATHRLPSAKVMAYTYLTPSWVIMWEIVLGHGAPRGLVLAGVALTIVALLILLKAEGDGSPSTKAA